MPVVSIVLPAHNAGRYIEAAIDSVRRQSCSDWELIIVDDGSTDNTAELIKAAQREDKRISVVRLPENSGGAATPRNRGIDKAKGRYIAFLDADDLWHPEKLEKQIPFMRRHQLAFCCTAYRVSNHHGKVVGMVIPPQAIGYKGLLLNNPIGCSTVVYDTAVLGRLQFSTVGHEDYDLWLKLAKNNVSMGGLADCLATYRKRKGSLSANKLKVIRYFYHLYRRSQGFNPVVAALLTLRYLFYSAFVKARGVASLRSGGTH